MMRVTVTLVALVAALTPMNRIIGAEAATATPITIVVFPFELEDLSPAGAAGLPHDASVDTNLQKTTVAAGEQLTGSGRYRIVAVDSGVDSEPLRKHMLRDCDGCEAAIAQKLGAQQSMIGLVRRATQTDYYIAVQIRDAATGKVIDTQAANFAGGPEGWATGTRMLIKHQVLAQ